MALRSTRQYVEVLANGTGKLRVTRQYVEVLANGTGKLRVTRQYVEVLADTAINGSASDTLSLSDFAGAVKTKEAVDTLSLSDATSVEIVHGGVDSLLLSDSVSLLGVYSRAATDVLSVVDTAPYSVIRLNVGIDSVSLTDLADAIKVRPASDSLTVLDTADVEVTHGVADALVLSDTVGLQAIFNRHTGDTLTLTDAIVDVSPRYVEAVDDLQDELIEYDVEGNATTIYLKLADTATATILRAGIPAVDTLYTLGDRAVAVLQRADAIECLAADSLTLADTAWANFVEDVADPVTLSDAAEAVTSKLATHTLSLADTATFNVVRVLTAVDTLSLDESVLCVNPNLSVEWVYRPFVGAGPMPMAATPVAPVPGIADGFRLVFPPEGPFTDTLVLRAPKFGNRDRLQMNRISRETRGGTLVVFADPIWPKVQSLAVQFEGLSQAEAAALLTFMDTHLGQEIGLLDWEHRYWKGVIVANDDPVVHDGKHGYSAGFEFEGELTAYPS